MLNDIQKPTPKQKKSKLENAMGLINLGMQGASLGSNLLDDSGSKKPKKNYLQSLQDQGMDLG